MEVVYLVQKPGDIVVGLPGTIYCAFDIGTNVSETINFMTFDDVQWRLSLSAMIVAVCNVDVDDHCEDGGKCKLHSARFLDINELADRVRLQIKHKAPATDIVPPRGKKGEDIPVYEQRIMSWSEIDARCTVHPQCELNCIYPCMDLEDHKFYPALCFSNRIISKSDLLLRYNYLMMFIGFEGYYQICNMEHIVSEGKMTEEEWISPPEQKQRGYFDDRGADGTPAFDWLKRGLENESISTRDIEFAYPNGNKKYDAMSRQKSVQIMLTDRRRLAAEICEYIHQANTDRQNEQDSDDDAWEPRMDGTKVQELDRHESLDNDADERDCDDTIFHFDAIDMETMMMAYTGTVRVPPSWNANYWWVNKDIEGWWVPMVVAMPAACQTMVQGKELTARDVLKHLSRNDCKETIEAETIEAFEPYPIL